MMLIALTETLGVSQSCRDSDGGLITQGPLYQEQDTTKLKYFLRLLQQYTLQVAYSKIYIVCSPFMYVVFRHASQFALLLD